MIKLLALVDPLLELYDYLTDDNDTVHFVVVGYRQSKPTQVVVEEIKLKAFSIKHLLLDTGVTPLIITTPNQYKDHRESLILQAEGLLTAGASQCTQAP